MLYVSYEKIMVNEYVDLWFVQTTISVVDGPNIDAGAVAGFSLKQVNKVFKDLGLDRRKPQDVSAVMNELINENSHIDFTSYVDTIGNEIKATELMFQLCGEAQSTHISAGLNTSPASLRPSKEKV